MTLHPSAAAAEASIDQEHEAHPFLARPYPEAIAHLLLAAEYVIGAHEPELQSRSVATTAVVNALKFAVRWVSMRAPETNSVEMSAEALLEADDFLFRAIAYTAVVSAYSYARREMIELSADGKQLRTTLPSGGDARYDAYDVLVLPSLHQARHDSPPSFFSVQRELEKCFERGMQIEAMPIDLPVLTAAYRVSTEIYDHDYQLPPQWQFGMFTVDEFRRVSNALRAVIGSWQLANQLEAVRDPSHSPRQLCVLDTAHLEAAVESVTGVATDTVSQIMTLLTYGSQEAKDPDPALQPLIEIFRGHLTTAAPLVLDSSPERNMIALLNTVPTERARYDGLKNEKEQLMRARMESRRPQYLHSWSGSVTNRPDLGNIDYLLFDERNGAVLLAELKSFTAPAEPREIAHRNKELLTGVGQINRLLAAFQATPDLLSAVVGTPTRVVGVVVSANAIGTTEVQHPSVPIINEEHLGMKLRVSASLPIVLDWLEARQYLPTEDVDFKYHRYTVDYFGWTLEWFGHEPLHGDAVVPL